MDFNSWDCCRTCLSGESLFSVFTEMEHHELYSNIIFTVTGIKVEINDNLPQQICTTCINFINDSIKFRKKCEQTNAQLLSRLDNKQTNIIKTEQKNFKLENEISTKIDISHLLTDLDNEFHDYDDNITLKSLKCYETKIDTSELENTENLAKESLTEEICKKNRKIIKKKRKTRTQSKKITIDNETERQKRKEMERKEVQCEYCHKILTSKLSLRNHYKIHTGFDVVCEHCGKKFITRRLLLMHCRAKHGYEKTDKCSFCDYRASNAEQVKIHERLHTGEKPYACGQCTAAFHRKSSYLQHIAIHLPEKTVQCDQCPARFKSVTLMRIHKSRHKASAYSFQCRVCEGSFARRRNVARHLLRVHNLPPEQHHIDRRKIG